MSLKEGLLAKLINKYHSHRKMTFVEISYAALPEPVLEAELFGYEENPFTRAIAITISTNAIKNYFKRHSCIEKACISRKWPKIEKYKENALVMNDPDLIDESLT